MDPLAVPTNYTPAVVHTDADALFVADADLNDHGWVSITRWDGSEALLSPQWVFKIERVSVEYTEGDLTATKSLAEESALDRARELGGTGTDDDPEVMTDGGVVQRVHPTELTLFQQEICYYLADEGPDYGLGIKRALEERYDQEINHGRLYPNLDELVREGLVEKSELDKRTNEYGLTDRGKELVHRDAQRRSSIADDMDGESE